MMLETVWLVREQIVSQRRSITFAKLAKTSLQKPRFRISFQICSMGFISGVYGGIWNSSIFFGISKAPDLCHAAPSQHSRITSSLYSSDKFRFILKHQPDHLAAVDNFQFFDSGLNFFEASIVVSSAFLGCLLRGITLRHP